jgi:chemotaxis receptor (MCP) glutamine deamidase CheD
MESPVSTRLYVAHRSAHPLNYPGVRMSILAESHARLSAIAPQSESTVYVHAGRTAAAHGGSFTTVVGSGAALCLHDPVRGVGGMAHFLLPESGRAPAAATRYGDVAVRTLLDALGKLGGRSYRAALYGGSAPPIASESGHLGDRNVAAAVALLAVRGIPLVDRDIGGVGARKIVFDVAEGRAHVTRVGA